MNRKVLILVLLVVVAIGLGIFLSPSASDGLREESGEARVATATTATSIPGSIVGPNSNSGNKTEIRSNRPVGRRAEVAGAVDFSDLGDEFTAEDAKTAGEPIYVDFGVYRVTAGEEFDIEIRLSAPSLENVCLYAEYDPTIVEGVKESGRKVGEVFRTGIEFYTRVHQGLGQAVIINETRPGSRNLNPSRGQVVASFRMKAISAGTAQLSFPKVHMSFSNAVGEDRLDYEISGGLIEVLP